MSETTAMGPVMTMTDSDYPLNEPSVEQQLRVTATSFVLQANAYEGDFAKFLDQCARVEDFLINGVEKV